MLRELRRVVPQDGTSLENAFAAAQSLAPRPDNIILVTDGLPTQGATPPAMRKTIDGEGRLKLFEQRDRQAAAGRAGQRDPAADGGRPARAGRVLGAGAPHRRRVPEPGEGLAVKRSRLGRRDVEVFSLSFLDAICCGFGAVILLLVLTEVGEPLVFEKSREDLEGRVLKLQQELAEIRGTSEVLNRELKARRIQLSEEQQKIARLRGDLSALRGQYESSRKDAEVANEIEGRLVSAQQDLTEEMKRLLGAEYRRKDDSPVGGVPVDSEYIIFIIDTSGSMANYAWPLMLRKMQEVLDAHPTVKGWQVMNDEGGYMFPSYRGRWLPDTPAQRKIVLDRLRRLVPVQQLEPGRGHRRGDPHLLRERAAHQPVRARRRVHRLVGRLGGARGGRDQPRGQGRATPRAHPRDRLPGAARRAAVHQRALRDADAHPVRPQRRHVRRPQRARAATGAERGRARMVRWTARCRIDGGAARCGVRATARGGAVAAARAARRLRPTQFEAQAGHPAAADHAHPGRGRRAHAGGSSARRCIARSTTARSTRSRSARRRRTGSSA